MPLDHPASKVKVKVMKRRIANALLLLIALGMLNACATVPVAPAEAERQIRGMTPPPDKALLHVYRNNLFLGSAVLYDIYIDERRLEGRLAVNTFLAVALSPGEHRFSYVPTHLPAAEVPAWLADKYLPMTVSAGKKYYLRISAAETPGEQEMVDTLPDAFANAKLIHRGREPVQIGAAGTAAPPPPAPPVGPGRGVKSDVDMLPAVKVKPDANLYAIVIGIEEYREKLPKAEFASDDARLMAEYVVNTLGVPEENLVLLTNGKASKSDLEKYFQRWLPNNVTSESEVFIYFSGHGAPNPSGNDAYLVPYDGDPTYISETGYPLHKLYDVLAKLPARRNLVILDSCFSGAGSRSVMAKGLRPLVVTAANQATIGGNTAVLSASAGNQVSSSYLEKGHGLLTYFVLKGLKEEAVLDQGGRLDLERLYPYVRKNVELTARKKYNNEQTPQLVDAKPVKADPASR